MSGELPGLTTRPCMVGFAQVPAGLYTAVPSHRAIVLWGVLDIHQGSQADTYPSREHLAEDLGCSVDSIERAAAELEQAGWLEIKRGRGRGNSNRYRVLGRPGKGRKSAEFSAVDNPGKHRKRAAFSAVDSPEKAANLRVEKAANLRPPTRGNEPESIGSASHLSTDRARERCEHGRPLAVDGTPTCARCAEQRRLWPAAVGH